MSLNPPCSLRASKCSISPISPCPLRLSPDSFVPRSQHSRNRYHIATQKDHKSASLHAPYLGFRTLIRTRKRKYPRCTVTWVWHQFTTSSQASRVLKVATSNLTFCDPEITIPSRTLEVYKVATSHRTFRVHGTSP